jgi:YihY family inner membrane protein
VSARPSARAVLHFVLHVLVDFYKNQGLLLAGAVAYYMLLAVVPLFALVLIGLSHLMPEAELLATVRAHLALLVPGHADALVTQISAVIGERKVFGVVGIGVLVFFAATAFTMLEKAMAVIFHRRTAAHRRHPVVSALIPFAFISFLALGILLVTVVSAALQTGTQSELDVLVFHVRLGTTSAIFLYVAGISGLVAMLSAVYMVMPVGRIAPKHALVGGIVATTLWELARHVMVWYFKTLSLVNVVYGSLATAVVALLGFEIAAIILLLGAQVIAELEHRRPDPEHEDPLHDAAD